MKNTRERILVVENDPDVCDQIARQTLQSLGYKVEVAQVAAMAIQQAAHFSPDLVIADLNLPGLSGKDLLVALSSQGLEVPVIILAQKGMEADVIQAFRLGASDYLMLPIREAELVSAVERVLKQVRSRQERESLERQVKQTNEELNRRVRELTTIFAVGKAVTSITNQQEMFEKIVEGAVFVSEADCGWLLVREDENKTYVLRAQRNLAKAIAARLNQPWDDGLSSLVALSGETLSIHGEPLTRFKVTQMGQSALVVPVKLKKEVIGLLVVVRKEDHPFNSSNQRLLEAVADYASISLVNSRLFRALQDRARTLQQAAESAQANARIKDEILQRIRHDLNTPLASAIQTIEGLLVGDNARLNAAQKGVLRSAQSKLQSVAAMLESLNNNRQKAP